MKYLILMLGIVVVSGVPHVGKGWVQGPSNPFLDSDIVPVMEAFTFLNPSYADFQVLNYPSSPLYNPFGRWVWQQQPQSGSIREPNYSRWSQDKKACIRRKDDEYVRTPNLKQCQLYCEDESDFPCKSVEFNPRTYQCHLSRYTRRSAEDDYIEPCIVPHWDYSEMVEWYTPFTNACTIGGEIEAKWKGTAESLLGCLKSCKDGPMDAPISFACRSVEFESISKSCYLFNTEETSDRRRPCPLAITDWNCAVVKVRQPGSGSK